MSRRTIPPWWANPIVFVPGITALAIILVCAALAVLWWPR